MTADLPGTAVSAPDAGHPEAADVEAIAGALGALVDSLLIHLRDRQLLDDKDIDEIYEMAIHAHRSIDGDALSARIAAVLGRMHSDGTTLRHPR